MKLLVLDVEGTLFGSGQRLPGTEIDSTIWQALARALGASAMGEEVASHGRWMRGEYRNYLEWMKDTIRIHQRHGLTEATFQSVIAGATYNPSVVDVLSSIDRRAFEPVLISGGFRELAARAQRDLGIIHAFAACEYIFDAAGDLRAFNLLPCDFDGKIDFIGLMLREYQLPPDSWVFVGDGLNDVPIAKLAPVSIGYHPHPGLRDVVSHVIENFSDLLPLLSRVAGARDGL